MVTGGIMLGTKKQYRVLYSKITRGILSWNRQVLSSIKCHLQTFIIIFNPYLDFFPIT